MSESGQHPNRRCYECDKRHRLWEASIPRYSRHSLLDAKPNQNEHTFAYKHTNKTNAHMKVMNICTYVHNAHMYANETNVCTERVYTSVHTKETRAQKGFTSAPLCVAQIEHTRHWSSAATYLSSRAGYSSSGARSYPSIISTASDVAFAIRWRHTSVDTCQSPIVCSFTAQLIVVSLAPTCPKSTPITQICLNHSQ